MSSTLSSRVPKLLTTQNDEPIDYVKDPECGGHCKSGAPEAWIEVSRISYLRHLLILPVLIPPSSLAFAFLARLCRPPRCHVSCITTFGVLDAHLRIG